MTPSTAQTSSLLDNKTVIAHRGASGYLPEHTLTAKALAYGMNADFIEQDVVMTKDDHLVVLHDLYLERISNVIALFPDRKRVDDHYYVIDFSLAELKTLSVHSPQNNQNQAKYSARFPLHKSTFSIHTLAEEIELIQGLNQATGKNVGLYVEIKAPWFHHQHNKDITVAILKTLKKYGYDSIDDKIYIQSFDANELKRIKQNLFAKLNIQLPLVQLIAQTSWQETQVFDKEKWQNYNYDWMFTEQGIKEVATYAQGIGPWFPMLIEKEQNNIIASKMLTAAKKNGLIIHPYTFRADREEIPRFVVNFEQFLQLYLGTLNVDGVFTDHPDKVIAFIEQN